MMTRFKIQKLKFFLFLSIFLLSQISTCNGNFRGKRQDPKLVPSTGVNTGTKGEVPQNDSKETSAHKINGTNIDVPPKVGSNITSSDNPTNNGVHNSSVNLDSGALMRGIFVLFGLGVLVMAYMVFRSFRLNKTRAQMVRKYGVLAHRQDVEMRPLPLDEDDEDDTTVFDASNIPVHGLQSQHS